MPFPIERIHVTSMNQVQFYRWLMLINGAVPVVMLAWDAWRGTLGANPATNALHVTGMLALVFLLLSLTITPLKRLSGWGGWLALRRGLGLYAFFYAVLHVAIYVTYDRALNALSTLNELLSRTFLQIGFAALVLMVPLAVTSTNAMQRKLEPSVGSGCTNWLISSRHWPLGTSSCR